VSQELSSPYLINTFSSSIAFIKLDEICVESSGWCGEPRQPRCESVKLLDQSIVFGKLEFALVSFK